jgi:hypothetical protein
VIKITVELFYFNFIYLPHSNLSMQYTLHDRALVKYLILKKCLY